MSYNKYEFDDIYLVDSIDFSLLSADEIIKQSVLPSASGVEYSELYSGGEPKTGGLNDPAMGTTSLKMLCSTCGYNHTYCEGHFGHINLSDNLFHILFLPHIFSMLSCICVRCSKLLVNRNPKQIQEICKTKFGISRFNAIKALSKNINQCWHCGYHVPKLKLNFQKSSSSIGIVIIPESDKSKNEGVQSKQSKKINLSAEAARILLQNISDDDMMILGWTPSKSRQESMIYEKLPVPPNAVRPTAQGDFGGGMSMENDLTARLGYIVKANNRIEKSRKGYDYNEKADMANMTTTLLQYHVGVYVDSDRIALQDKKGVPLKSIVSRLKGKEGRFRSNLSGKRVDFNGRTVITADPNIDINEVGVPVKIAMIVTFPEIVTLDNINNMRKLVRNGRDIYPGANYVFKASEAEPGRRVTQKDLRYGRDRIELRPGDIVERHMQTGDILLFNRQPSLHKQSMMGHKAKVIDNLGLLTFRLAPPVTPPYNADFDGDEMNGYLPQSIQTQIELEEISSVEKQIITGTTSKTIIGIVQDGLVGSRNLTSGTVEFDWRTYMNIIGTTEFDKYDILKKEGTYTGKELYSLIIPKEISVKKDDILIEHGKLIAGRLGKNMLGHGRKNNLIQLIWDAKKAQETRKFIDNNQRLLNNYNLYRGFTIGIKDALIPEKLDKMIETKCRTTELTTERLITKVGNNPDLMDADIYEFSLFNEYKSIRDDAGKIVLQNLSPENAFLIMEKSGSKGDLDNICQIAGLIGLQIFENGLIPKKYNNRTSCYYVQHDDRARSRGVIMSSFLKGLTFQQFVFMLMTGRMGTIDQVIGTADTGYITRKLVKMLEDIKITYDYTVRNANDVIMQLVYGDSGADPIKQTEYTIKMLEYDNQKMSNVFEFTTEELKQYGMTAKDNNEYINFLMRLRNKIRKSTTRSYMEYLVQTTSFMIPVHLTSIINRSLTLEKTSNEKLTPKYILEMIEYVLKNEQTMMVCVHPVDRKSGKSFKLKDEMVNKTIFMTCLYDALSPKRCLVEYRLTKNQFDFIIEEISNNFNKNMIEPGEMVGIQAATSLGEPATQMKLNSFHVSGLGRGGGNSGVPRFQELLDATTSLKTPINTIFLNDESKTNLDIARKIVSNLKYTTLEQIRGKIKTYYDPFPYAEHGTLDSDNVRAEIYNKTTKKNEKIDLTGLPFLMRIELNKEQLFEKEVQIIDIVSKLSSRFNKKLMDSKNMKKDEKKVMSKFSHITVLSNSDNDKQPVLHIRFNIREGNTDEGFSSEIINEFIRVILNPFRLKGINSIKDAYIEEKKIVSFNKTTGAVEKNTEYLIKTSGVNLLEIKNFTDINLKKSFSNDIMKIFNVYGIEVARAMLIREIINAYSAAGKEINYQHAELVADKMTSTGTFIPINRFGMSKSDSDPLPRASFERSIEHIINAAMFSETDHMKGVSSKIMFGQVINGGTGFCNLILDTEMIEKSEHTEHNDYTVKTNIIETDTVATDIIGSKSINSIGFMPE